MAGVSIVLLLRQAGGSYAAAGAVTGVFSAGSAAGAPWHGWLAGRFGEARALLASASTFAVAFLTLALTLRAAVPLPAVLACAAVAGLAVSPLCACLRARVPWLPAGGGDAGRVEAGGPAGGGTGGGGDGGPRGADGRQAGGRPQVGNGALGGDDDRLLRELPPPRAARVGAPSPRTTRARQAIGPLLGSLIPAEPFAGKATGLWFLPQAMAGSAPPPSAALPEHPAGAGPAAPAALPAGPLPAGLLPAAPQSAGPLRAVPLPAGPAALPAGPLPAAPQSAGPLPVGPAAPAPLSAAPPPDGPPPDGPPHVGPLLPDPPWLLALDYHDRAGDDRDTGRGRLADVTTPRRRGLPVLRPGRSPRPALPEPAPRSEQAAPSDAPPAPGRGAGSLRSPGMRTLAAAAALGGLSVGTLQVTIAAFAEAEGSRGVALLLLALWGAGGVAAGRWYAGRRHGLAPVRFVAAGCVLAASMLAPAIAIGLPQMGLALALCGGCLPPWLAGAYATAGELVPPGNAAKAARRIFGSFLGGVAGGAVLSGGIVALGGARPALAAAFLGAAGAALVASRRRHTLRLAPPPPQAPPRAPAI